MTYLGGPPTEHKLNSYSFSIVAIHRHDLRTSIAFVTEDPTSLRTCRGPSITDLVALLNVQTIHSAHSRTDVCLLDFLSLVLDPVTIDLSMKHAPHE